MHWTPCAGCEDQPMSVERGIVAGLMQPSQRLLLALNAPKDADQFVTQDQSSETVASLEFVPDSATPADSKGRTDTQPPTENIDVPPRQPEDLRLP